MDNHAQAPVQGPSGPNAFRTTARVVGAIYLAGMVVGIGRNILIPSIVGAPDRLAAVSASTMLVAVGTVLWLIAVGIAAGLLAPAGWPAAGAINTVSYLAWSAWLIALGVTLLIGRARVVVIAHPAPVAA